MLTNLKHQIWNTVSSEVSAGQLGVLQVNSTAVACIACGLKRILFNLINERPNIEITWPVLTNQRPLLRFINQSEASIEARWPMRGQYWPGSGSVDGRVWCRWPGCARPWPHWTRSSGSRKIWTESMLTNQKLVFGSRDLLLCYLVHDFSGFLPFSLDTGTRM